MYQRTLKDLRMWQEMDERELPAAFSAKDRHDLEEGKEVSSPYGTDVIYRKVEDGDEKR